MHCNASIIAVERLNRAIEILDKELEVRRTTIVRLTGQLEGFKADNLKLQGDVRKLQEALAAASLDNVAVDRLYRDATITELTRKLYERDKSLEASRARAMSLQRRINASAALVNQLPAALGEVIVY
jgi:chromosome segregation ATPase